VLQGEVASRHRRPLRIEGQHGGRVAEHQAQHHLGDDAPAHRPQLRSRDRAGRARGGDIHRRLVRRRLGQDIGPERAVSGEHAVGDRVDRHELHARILRLDRLVDEDLGVVQRGEVHGPGHGLAGGQAQPPAALEIAQAQGGGIGGHGRGEGGERVRQGRVDPVGELQPLPVVRVLPVAAIGAGVEIDEPAPVDRPPGRHGLEAGQGVGEAGGGEDRQQHVVGVVQPVAGADHRMAQAIGAHRELHRHEREVAPVEVLQPGRIVSAVGPKRVQHRGADDPGQEVVQHHVLVVEADPPLQRLEIKRVIVLHHPIMEAQEQALELGDDAVLVVARVADQGAAPEPGQVVGVGDALALQHLAQVKALAIVLIEIGLIAGPPAIDIVEVQSRRAEIHQAVGILGLGEQAHRVEGDVVVDELAEIGVEGRDSALLAVRAVLRRIEGRRHLVGERGEVGEAVFVVGAEDSGWQVAEHPAEAALEQARAGGVETPRRRAVA
jgi:hypothetical protein